MGTRIGVRVGLTAGIVLSMASSARADDAAQAAFHASLATKLYSQARFEEALRNFFIVRRLTPDAKTLYNIAICFDELDKPDRAFLYYSQYLSETEGSESAASFRGIAKERIDALRRRVALIEVDSTPPGADVYLDLREHGAWGQTPMTVPVSAGEHTVWVRSPNHKEASVEVRAKRGEQARVEVDLVPILGTLAATSEPPAEVLVTDPDGASFARGETPFETRLPPGVYVVELSAAAHRPQRAVVRVGPDQRTERTFALVPLPPERGKLTVASIPAGALVEIDGEQTQFTPAILDDVALGLRTVRVTTKGTQPWEGPVEVQDEGRGYLTVTLAPPARVERSVATWVFGGVGASALSAALITGILALDAKNEFDDAQAGGNPGGTDLAQLKEQGETLAGVTDALLVAGGVSLVTATILFFTTAKKTRPSDASLEWTLP